MIVPYIVSDVRTSSLAYLFFYSLQADLSAMDLQTCMSMKPDVSVST
jgi:hypothetical protein